MATARLISSYVSTKNFLRFSHKLFIRNETSQTQFLKSESILIIELIDNGIVLELPLNVCQRGHNLTLFFLEPGVEPIMKLPNTGRYKEAMMEIVAKVDKIEKVESKNNTILVHINFIQYDLKQWKKIVDCCVENQEALNNLIHEQHNKQEEK